jgi:curved DNA-binding protein CbpA
MDYYRVLGVAKSASSSEIKLAFRALALKLHPDIAKSDKTESLHAFQRVSTAYETLSNKTKKELYDYEIGNIQNGANIGGTRFRPPSMRNNRPGSNTEYHPGGSAHNRRNSSTRDIPTEHFNMHQWVQGHYGDTDEGREARRSTRPNAADYIDPQYQQQQQQRGWMNMGKNKHQKWFHKKRESVNVNRSPGEDAAFSAFSAYAAQQANMKENMNRSRAEATEKINKNREERRNNPKSSSDTGNGLKQDDSCTIS